MHIYTCTHTDIIFLHLLYTVYLLWISVRNNYIFLLMSEWKNSRHKKQLLCSHFVCWTYQINEAEPLYAAFALLLAHSSCFPRACVLLGRLHIASHVQIVWYSLLSKSSVTHPHPGQGSDYDPGQHFSGRTWGFSKPWFENTFLL